MYVCLNTKKGKKSVTSLPHAEISYAALDMTGVLHCIHIDHMDTSLPHAEISYAALDMTEVLHCIHIDHMDT